MKTDRRTFLLTTLALIGAPNRTGLTAENLQGKILTVLGPISPQEMGTVLTHEHVMVDFIGADQVSPDRYDADEVFNTALPYLNQVMQLGCDTLVECTPAYIGRDAALLKRLAQETGLHILTNTGYYGAANDKFVPQHAFEESAEQLASRWVKEWNDGIDGTDIRPGFIKIGVDSGPLSEIDRKIVHAAALTHLQTGLTIAAHTGNGVAALEEIEVLRENGVSAEALIWVHAQNENDLTHLIKAAEQGAWISLDGISNDSIGNHLSKVLTLKAAGHVERILLSHDAGWYHVGEPGGGNFRPYDMLFKDFIPLLKQKGVDEETVNQLVKKNPQKAFTILNRSLTGVR